MVTEQSSNILPNKKVASKDTLPKTLEERDNNFNFLRLLFASLVILFHSTVLVDNYDIVNRIFHTYTLGDHAVNGFFMLSGFLIIQSWQRRPRFLPFFKKRALRIYPGFIAASILSAFIAGPLGANTAQYFAHFSWLQFLEGVVLLQEPRVPPVFIGTPYPALNSPMWTISFEFRCYLLVALFGIFGVIKNRRLWFVLSLIALGFAIAPVEIYDLFSGTAILIGNPLQFARLFSFFSIGGCFYLFRDRIHYKSGWAIAAIPILLLCLSSWRLSVIALNTLGAYILFWFAFAHFPVLDRFKRHSDISYGVYLYGWPIQKLLLWYTPSLSAELLFLLSLGMSSICGLASWHLIELPFLRLKTRLDPRDTTSIEELKSIQHNTR